MKNTNIKIKLIILFLVAVAFLLILSNKAFATEGLVTSGEVNENSLNSIPDKITLDIQEIEFEKAYEVAYPQIAALLKEQGIIADTGSDTYIENGMVLSVNATTYGGNNIIIPRNIEIYLQDRSNNTTIASKTITFTYNNSSKYNEADKKYVEDLIKNIDLPKTNTDMGEGYLIIDSIELNSNKSFGHQKAIDVLTEKLKDSNISVAYTGIALGDGALINGSEMSIYAIFKDNIYYATVPTNRIMLYQITVPATTKDTETEFINYAKPILNKYVEQEFKNISITSIKKASGYYYDVTFLDSTDNKSVTQKIIIKKADGAPAGNDIYVDNLTEGLNITAKPINSSTVMISKVNDKGYNKILGSYELTLTGAKNLSESIDVTFTVGEEYNNQTVYILHQKKDGSFEDFTRTVTNGKITITVDELSPFTLAVKTNATNNTNNEDNQETQKPSNNTNKGELDETPKTGYSLNNVGIIGFVAIVSLAGIVITKKFNK